MKLPLSVVVITKNEEGRLADCLASAAPLASEIIVVDDFSQDGTVEVARRFAQKVIQRKMDVEGRHRNYAYSLATQPWVLSLDADERITPELADEIVKLLTNNPSANGYTIPRKNFLGNTWLRHGGQYPSAQLRLFRNGVFKYEEADVHPRAFMQDPRGALRAPLVHYTYRDVSDLVAKLNRQTTLEATKWFKENRKIGLRKSLWRTVDRFWRAYIGKKGYKDGFPGFVVALTGGLYQILSYAKFREMKDRDGSHSPVIPVRTVPDNS